MEHFKADTHSMLSGVIGNPLDHSVSAKIHNALYAYYGINAVYLPFTLEPEGLKDFLQAAKLLHIPGFGVTMPYKSQILPYLDDAQPEAKIFGCVNQVSVSPEGKTYGYITDGYGMCQAIERTGFRIAGKNALVLGAGAIGGIIGYELLKRGAAQVVILNRTPQKAQAAADKLEKACGKSVIWGGMTRENLEIYAAQSNLAVQCTSLGMAGGKEDFPYLDFIGRMPAGSLAADAIYNPYRTAFLKRAEQAGLTVVNGIPMLIEQLAKNLEYNIGFCEVERGGLNMAQQLMEKELGGMGK